MNKGKYIWVLNEYKKGDTLGYITKDGELQDVYLERKEKVLSPNVKSIYSDYPDCKIEKCKDLEEFVTEWVDKYNQEPLTNRGMSEYVVLDLETTGLSVNNSNIIEIGAWKIKDGVTVSEFTELVKPPYTLPYNIVTITHITDYMLETARPIKEVLPEFIDWLGDYPLLGHNLMFDYNFLKRDCEVTGDDITLNGMRRGVDTLKLCKELYNFKSNKLEDVAKEFNINIASGNLHRARVDAYITKQVYERIASAYGGMTRVNTPVLLEDKNKKEEGSCYDGEVISFS